MSTNKHNTPEWEFKGFDGAVEHSKEMHMQEYLQSGHKAADLNEWLLDVADDRRAGYDEVLSRQPLADEPTILNKFINLFTKTRR